MTYTPHELSHHSHESMSAWMSDQEMPITEELMRDEDFDVCIVGGGIAGLTTAYLLAKEGKKVCVLEDSAVGSGQTGRTTIQMSTYPDCGYCKLESIHGVEALKTIAQGQMEALRLVEEITRTENINCDLSYVDGYLFSEAKTDDDNPAQALETAKDEIRDEFAATQRAGLLNVEYLAKGPFSFASGPVLKFPKQIQMHPLKYLTGLLTAVQKYGGKVFTGTHVAEVNSAGDRPFVKTARGITVTADALVIATHSPINNRISLHTKEYAYRTYVVGFRVAKGAFPEGMFWDTENPYHYLRTVSELKLGGVSGADASDVLLVGGEDHRTGQNSHPEECYERLIQWTRARFAQAGEVVYRWSGQVMESFDGLPFMGHNPYDSKNVYVLTGDCGDGTTFFTLGAKIITDQIFERENAFAALYSPSRFSVKALPGFLKESFNEASQYLKWLTPEQVENIEAIPPGEGALMGNGVTKLAVYRDDTGHLFWISAKCTHMGGAVCWNSSEKSWDCPCHGARFDPYGHVIEGPAMTDLEAIHSYGSPAERPETLREKAERLITPEAPLEV